MTTSLLRSPGLFSAFCSILAMLYFGLSPFIIISKNLFSSYNSISNCNISKLKQSYSLKLKMIKGINNKSQTITKSFVRFQDPDMMRIYIYIYIYIYINVFQAWNWIITKWDNSRLGVYHCRSSSELVFSMSFLSCLILIISQSPPCICCLTKRIVNKILFFFYQYGLISLKVNEHHVKTHENLSFFTVFKFFLHRFSFSP